MAVPLHLFVGAGSLLVALVLAYIQRDSRFLEDVNLPYGFNLPLLVAFTGAGYYTLAESGLTGVYQQIANVIFFSTVTILVVQKYLRDKKDASL